MRRACLIAPTAAFVLFAASAQAVAPPTGDPAEIDFYEQQANAYAQVAGMKMVETGFFYMRPSANRSVDYWWGSRPPAGQYYRPATATIRARLSGGKIVAYLAELTATKVRTLRILMAGGSVYTRTTGCWRKTTPGASPLGTGERYVFNDGGARFVTSPGNTVKFTYAWVPGTQATETNYFKSAAKPSPVVVSIRVAGSRSLVIHKSIAPLRAAPALPVPAPPARPEPKPLCPT
jgi:hypothetical protein